MRICVLAVAAAALGAWPLAALTAAETTASDTVQFVAHQPLVVQSRTQVEIDAYFKAPQPIRSVTIYVQEQAVAALHPQLPRIFPVGGRVERTSKWKCKFDSDAAMGEVSCAVEHLQFAKDTLVTYWATADTGALGLYADPVTFSVLGRPAAGTILPVYSHRQHTVAPLIADCSNHPPVRTASRVSLGFAPSLDYGDADGYNDFLRHLGVMLEGVFNNHKSQGAGELYSADLPAFDLFVGSQDQDDKDRCETPPAVLPWHLAVTAPIFLHKRPIRDCAIVGRTGWATVYARSNVSPQILAHETGHCVHGLADESDCGFHKQVGDCQNIFKNEDECKQKHPGSKCTAAQCSPVADPFWFVDGSGRELMRQLDADPDWQLVTRQCVDCHLVSAHAGLRRHFTQVRASLEKVYSHQVSPFLEPDTALARALEIDWWLDPEENLTVTGYSYSSIIEVPKAHDFLRISGDPASDPSRLLVACDTNIPLADVTLPYQLAVENRGPRQLMQGSVLVLVPNSKAALHLLWRKQAPLIIPPPPA